MDVIAAGDRILAFDPANGHRWLLIADGGGARKEKGLGIVDPDRLVGEPWGAALQVGAKHVLLLPPTLPDLGRTLRRKAQIITPKDASRIVYELGLAPGHHVLESGIGSGAATLALLHAVAPGGHVVAQELREDFATWAAKNVARAGMEDALTVALGDLTQGAAEAVTAAAADRPFDACLLDQPEPWLAIPHVAPTLAVGARIVCYTPNVSQMEQTVAALTEAGFIDVRCIEVMERSWKVGERGSRPDFDALGFTAFLTFARWPGGAPATESEPGPSSEAAS
ncbi:MAG: tRNA (adenine-N1)-methyltransferase [Thermoplasmatota archaeon]